MQDRFKFRIFDKEQKKIVTTPRHFNFGIVNGTVVLLESCPTVAGFYNKRIAKEYDDVILMQCTGIKDKNGKLIYEGDIIADVVSGCVAIIEYLHSSYSFMAHIRRMDEFVSIEDICFVDKEGTPFEVVGNIYENPELLEINNEEINN